jgi:uncharacterized protein (TIGR02145 family)
MSSFQGVIIKRKKHMKQFTQITFVIGLFATAALSQNISTPVFVLKDGDASVSGYTGSDKEIVVDGSSQQNVGWITFQTQGIDFSKIGSAKLSLYVKSVKTPGTLQIRLLTSAITAPENNVKLFDIPADVAVTDSIALGTADVEKMIQLDLTSSVKASTFNGVVLTSNNGLSAAFDSKEGRLAPVILLTHNVADVASKWLSGTGTPSASVGKDGDYYLNTASGDVSAKSTGVWSVVTNVVGPAGTAGSKGDQGDPGVAFDDAQVLTTKTWSSSKVSSELGKKVDKVTGKGLSSEDYTSAEKNKLAAISGTNTGDQDLSGLATKTEVATGLSSKVDKITGKGLSTKDYTATDSTKVAAATLGTAKGDMQYWDGTKWVRVAAGQPGQMMTFSGSNIPQWSQIPGTVTDIDGNVYRTIVIGNQEWTMQNIRTTHYNDGTAIPNVTDNTVWSGLTTGAFCYYNNTTDAEAQKKYGALYNGYAVNTVNLAPSGWRVPDTTDWNNLENYLIANGYNYDGTTSGNKIAKSMAAGIWSSITNAGAIGNNLNLNNKSGFSAFAGGRRSGDGSFGVQDLHCYWWSSTTSATSLVWCLNLVYNSSYPYRADYSKSCGFSVRLVRDLN